MVMVRVNYLYAGGSGLNTVVVINQSSSNSCALANYFCERRLVPPENILRLSWLGNNISWTSNEFVTILLDPLSEMLTGRGLTNQINYVVLSMDIPFQTIWNTTNVNSTTSALFYGLKTYLGSQNHTNSYAASEASFPQAKPASAAGDSFLATMITGHSLAEAMQLVDQGVDSDGTFPSQTVVLAQTTDPNRNIRRLMFDNAVVNASILGKSSVMRTNSDNPSGQTNLLGYETGLYRYNVSPGTFRPGAIADNVTSFGGVIFGPNDHTNLLAFLNAGAAGSYGTVAEPLSDTDKFPNPQVYFYQARGFSLAECYYQSVNQPYLGLTVAEPLAAPFASSGTGAWKTGVSNSTLTGTVPLTVNFSACDSTRPLYQVDLFVDGRFYSTLTNLAPNPGNILSIALNGYPFNYPVPTNATIGSIASNLAALINTSIATNVTKVKALQFGDRIELQSISTNQASFPFCATDTVSAFATGVTYRVTYLPESFPPRMLPAGFDKTGLYHMQVEIPTPLNYVIQASTNLIDWQSIFTNTVPGLVDFHDSDSTNYWRRFYRVLGPVPDLPPKISPLAFTNGAGFRVRIESQMGQPCAIVASTNQLDWSVMITNQPGGILDFLDTTATNTPSRFYRAWLIPTPQPSLSLTNLAGATLVQVQNATQPYIIELRTNGVDWISLSTNFAFRDIQTTASSSTGNAGSLTTFLNASQPTFLIPNTYGVQDCTFLSGILTVGAWAKITFTKTNNQTVIVAATNYVAGINTTNLAFALYNLTTTNSALQGPDGVSVENYHVTGGQAIFTIRARSPGYPAAQLVVLAKGSGFATGVSISPGTYRRLTQNLSDLQPRNHLYVNAGATQMGVDFLLDTPQLSDGYHELTAVAYEGSHVRTQTHTTIPVCLSNSPLSATLTLLDLTNNAPAQAIYHIEVTANTNNVSLVTLFSTGGPIGFATNSPATFDVIGTNLWAGLHPFYALVETASGQQYRTQTYWVRLQ